MQRVVIMLASGALASLTWSGLAAAATPVCGQKAKGAAQPAEATLALADADPETVTAALYGRRTGLRQLTLVYTVSGCRLAQKMAIPDDPPPIGPPRDAKLNTIPKGVIRIAEDPEIDGNKYVVHLHVDTAPPGYVEPRTRKKVHPKFAPGTYGGFVHLRADWMHRTGTPVAISRSENRWLLVLGVAVIGAFGGFMFFMILHSFSRARLLVGVPKLVIAGVLSVSIGAYVGYTTNYLNQDVWTFGSNTIAMLTAAFTAATSGQLVTGLLGKVYDDMSQVNPTEPVTAADAPRAGWRGAADRVAHPVRTRQGARMKRERQNADPEQGEHPQR